MKLKLLSLFALMLLSLTTFAQQERCSTMPHLEYQKQVDNQVEKRMSKVNTQVQEWIKNNPEAHKNGAVITIPVVVHVVYGTNAENISDQRIFEQIQILNDDFRRTNSDAGNTPSQWQGIAADTEIEFCLAVRDPSGAATDGITRTSTTQGSFSTNDGVKYDAQGGKDAWPSSDYMNFWSCDLGPGLLGYAQFPGGAAATDGVVMGYSYVGLTGGTFGLGRTATHEVGHWLGLRHIWGDGGCGVDDGIADTPESDASNGGCPTTHQSCGTTDMVQNYMDYTNDACMNLFTDGQSAVMNGVMNSNRVSLQSSLGCVPVNLNTNDAEMLAVINPTGTYCDANVVPEVTLRNYGSATLTSATIMYNVDAGANQTFNWTGNLASLATTDITLPAISAGAAGAHIFNVTVSNPNGGSDDDNTNNANSSSFTVSAGSGVSVAYNQGFESGLPTDWTINNPDGGITWEPYTGAGSEGSSCMYIDLYNYGANGEIDEMIMPSVDLSTVTDAFLSFDYAHALYSGLSEPITDSLEILVSADCGQSYTSMAVWAFADLLTGPEDQTTAFFPNANQWDSKMVDLSAYDGNPGLDIVFRSYCNYENNLFIDKVLVDGNPIGINNVSELTNSINIYPNPNSGAFTVNWTSELSNNTTVELVNILGQTVKTFSVENTNSLTINEELSSGYYFVKITSENFTSTKKVVVE